VYIFFQLKKLPLSLVTLQREKLRVFAKLHLRHFFLTTMALKPFFNMLLLAVNSALQHRRN
jgi:hypothetical protein